MNRREFLKLALLLPAQVLLTHVPNVTESITSVAQDESQEWAFPLAFPAWFPVEPRKLDEQKALDDQATVYLPQVTRGASSL